MTNPFRFGGPVEEAGFCDREPQLRRVLATAEEGGLLVAAGPSGAGVTSLLHRALRELRHRGYLVAHTDLWPVESRRALRDRLARGLGPLEPDAAAPSTPADDPLGGALERVAAAAASRDATGVLALDESKRLLELDDLELEVLRSGPEESDAPVARLLFATPTRRQAALARALGLEPGDGEGGPGWLELGPVPVEAWLPFVLERFLETDLWIGNEHVEEAVRLSGGHPRRTQELLHTLWELGRAEGGVSSALLERALLRTLERRNMGYGLLWEALTANQRRVLLGLAAEGGEARPFSSDFVHRYGLTSPSSAQRALESLAERALVRRRDDGPEFADPFLREWIRHRS